VAARALASATASASATIPVTSRRIIATNREKPVPMIRNYLLILFRNLRRNKVFISVNVLGMAVAIA
jgi:hypothetical protein